MLHKSLIAWRTSNVAYQVQLPALFKFVHQLAKSIDENILAFVMATWIVFKKSRDIQYDFFFFEPPPTNSQAEYTTSDVHPHFLRSHFAVKFELAVMTS